MAQLHVRLSVRFKWWLWPLAWCAYPFLFIAGEPATLRFVSWLASAAMVIEAERT